MYIIDTDNYYFSKQKCVDTQTIQSTTDIIVHLPIMMMKYKNKIYMLKNHSVYVHVN
jgi:hypothetical protein